MANVQPSTYPDSSLDRDMRRVFLMSQNIPVMGSAIVTGKLLQFPTGMVTVTACIGSIDNGNVAHSYTLTVTPSASILGSIDIFIWQPTSAGDTTPIAATLPVTVRWLVQGTL